MTITERLQTEFSGITAMIAGFVNALRARRAYNRALVSIEKSYIFILYKEGLSEEELKLFYKPFGDEMPVEVYIAIQAAKQRR
jgi:hypothetical protein